MNKLYFLLPFIFTLACNQTPTTTLYIAPDGSDTHPGTKKAPVASLDKAREIVRSRNQDMKEDITIYLRQGEYPIQTTIQFDARDSGTNGFQIIYKNYPDENAVLTGGIRITDWHMVSNSGIWRATVPSGTETRELYVNGKRATIARGAVTETTEWKAVDDPFLEKSNQVETVDTYQGRLPVYAGYRATGPYHKLLDWKNKSDIEFVYLHGWTYVICPVASIRPMDDGNIFIQMQNPCFRDAQIKGGLHVNDPSYIQNAYELLDEPNEWYLDRTSNTLYYIPSPEIDMSTAEFIIPKIENLIEIQGTLDNPVHDIRFDGIDFQYTTFLRPGREGFAEVQATFTKDPNVDDNAHSHYIKTTAGIVLDAAHSITFHRCSFSRFGAAGINIQNGSKHNTLRGCRITEMGASGVQIGGFNIDDAQPDDQREIVKGNVVDNCYIHQIGTIYKGAVGVIAGYTDSTVVSHNEISNVGYTGVSIGWGWGFWDKGGRPHSKKHPAPPHYPIFDKPTVSKNNHVLYNHIHNVTRKLHDGGGIYTLSMMENSVIRGNLIHDNGGWPGGIYLDEASGGITVTENAVYNVAKGFNYHEVGLPGRRETCSVHDNYFDHPPPPKIVEKAGLEEIYRDVLLKQ